MIAIKLISPYPLFTRSLHLIGSRVEDVTKVQKPVRFGIDCWRLRHIHVGQYELPGRGSGSYCQYREQVPISILSVCENFNSDNNPHVAYPVAQARTARALGAGARIHEK